MSLLHLAIMLPFLYAAISPVLLRPLRRVHAGWLVLPVPALLFAYFLTELPLISGGGAREHAVPWIPSIGIQFTVYLDGLSLLFALLICGIGSLVVLYSIFYLDKEREPLHTFYLYLLLFMGAMLGVVLSDNMIVLYGFWELTSLSSFLLIAFWHYRERSRYGALKSMLITVLGGLAMLAGFVMLYVMSGTFSIREIVHNADQLAAHNLFLPALALILLGAFTKSAQFPFHIWLPDAMEAPTPVSAYLHSATMVKAGLYLVARLSPVFEGQPLWFWAVSLTGLLTLVYGSFRALKQTDLKAMLAYSTISQLGLIMSLLGLGSASAFFTGAPASLLYAKATMAALFHLMNHAVFKGALFMVVGIVDHETGTRDIRKLGGLLTVMPVTFSAAVIGACSMAGLPPFGGFLSKEMFFTAMLQISQLDVLNIGALTVLFPVVAWLASILTFGYSMILLLRTFTGRYKPEQLAKAPHEAPLGMLISPVVLASLAVVFGLFPNLLSQTLIGPGMAAIHPGLLLPGDRFAVSIQMWHGWTTELYMTIGVVIIGSIVYKLHPRFGMLNSPLFRKPSLNLAYDQGLKLLHRGSRRLTGTYMTGSVRHYAIYVFLFLILSLSWSLLRSGALSFDMSGFAPVSVYEALINGALIVSVLAVPFARTRLTAIIWTGTAGYMVTLFFVIFRAPDLALTQMIVETVSVALFLLCFYHLPKLKKEVVKLPFKLTNALISVGVGVLVTLIALSASGSRPFASISDYFLKSSYELAGGKNVVNVILVDFRGFDTMLEIVVLGIASYGIYALIRLKPAEEEEPLSAAVRQTSITLPQVRKAEPKPDDSRPAAQHPRSNDVILRTISRVAVFIILTFSLYLFFAGHNQPGGGFIGALMTAAALILLAISHGAAAIRSIIPLDFRRMTAIGLLIAVLTGAGSFLFREPFLTHAFGYFELPLLGKTELATAVLFDLGVYLTVIGITMTIIFTIGSDKD
ncbi:multicomponent Na+:H+ antiporter subunit A [Paenibacillus sp. UNCCL117]|uniref:Na+/H+ antiporter subunit A n=1 Tax=unclassified Paenibacillus TaxID=185978 RepID=UPI000888FE55|nr:MULTISPECIES: Na+/H+ antiporter subunit A [unclassified Paenibacillus]SDC18164.1 multicomponent Na+:H+ antiporter subunit A [Paenibacillus sp. cl123]SFW18151.1 multicomponent Na+:H+ antiporter subunit A [Paenibacillus sp. UNCCL117]